MVHFMDGAGQHLSGIPQLGIGTYMIDDAQLCRETVMAALRSGYRHIDTAQVYKNEAAVGDAIAESGLDRELVFITTKLWVSNFSYEKARNSIDASLKRLRTDYIDLMLIHRPYGDYTGAWKAMEEALEAGKIRAIGVSNFNQKQMRTLLNTARIKPVMNQIECHPYYQQQELRQFLQEQGIAVGAWYPLGHGDKKLMHDPVLEEMARKHGRSVVQIVLRWHIQSGNIVVPKSTKEQHMRSNREVYDFTLSGEEMDQIAQMDRGASLYRCPLWIDEWKARLFVRA